MHRQFNAARNQVAIENADIENPFGEDTSKWKCRGCGCTNERACAGGCCWVEKNLCDKCHAWSDNFTRDEVAAIRDALLIRKLARPSSTRLIEALLRRFPKS